MARLDHIQLNVHDWRGSRDWWRDRLGFQVEMEMPDARTAGLKDDADLTVFLCEGPVTPSPELSFTVQVDDVEARFEALTAAGVEFIHPPMKVSWGYGAELRDPNGYRLRLWDPASMAAKGGA